MKNKKNSEKEEQKIKDKRKDLFVRACVLPLIIGFSLVYADISMKIFNVIGWLLLLTGIVTGFIFLQSSLKNNQGKIVKFLRRMKILKTPNVLSDEEVNKKMEEKE